MIFGPFAYSIAIFYEREFTDFEVLAVHPGAQTATRSQFHGKADRHMRLLTIGNGKQVGHTLGSRRV
jgi:hypothetical protein